MALSPHSDAAADDRPRVLPFALEETRYCVLVDRVTAALGVDDYAAIEAAPDPLRAGELTVDGTQIRVVDLARVLGAGAPERADEPKLVVFAVGDGDRRGWLVDDVGAVRTVDPAALEPSGHARYVRGKLELDGERTIWLNERAING